MTRLPALRVGPASEDRTPADRPAAGVRLALALSWVAVVVTGVASVAGLFVDELYRGGAAVAAASRGGDLVTLAVGVPVLSGALFAASRGSRRGQLVWLGVLGYLLYSYAYHVFTPTFNEAFLAHVAVFTLAWVAMVFALAGLDVVALAARGAM